MGAANRFCFNSDLFTSFTAIRPECPVPWYPFVDNFPEPMLLVFAPTADAESAGWMEAELLPEFRYFDLVITALEDYFGV